MKNNFRAPITQVLAFRRALSSGGKDEQSYSFMAPASEGPC